MAIIRKVSPGRPIILANIAKLPVTAARDADAILFGAMGWPEIRYHDGTEIAPQLGLRISRELYAGVRPARAIPGLRLPLADPRARDIDLVVVRESTEGLFASRGKGVIDDDREARDTMVITRRGSERVHDFAFRLAQRRIDGVFSRIKAATGEGHLRRMRAQRGGAFGEDDVDSWLRQQNEHRGFSRVGAPATGSATACPASVQHVAGEVFDSNRLPQLLNSHALRISPPSTDRLTPNPTTHPLPRPTLRAKQ